MPIMIDSLSSISPTLTLVELYETQKHYIAAFTILKYLALKKPDERIDTLLAKLQDNTFGEDYRLSFLNEIMTDEEAVQLGILPSGLFRKFQQIVDELLKKEETELDVDDLEAEYLFSEIEKKISTEWEQIIASEKEKRERKIVQPISLEQIDWREIKLVDFVEYLFALKDDAKDLDNLKMADIMEIFFSRYKLNNEKEEQS